MLLKINAGAALNAFTERGKNSKAAQEDKNTRKNETGKKKEILCGK